ncbi:recombinase family protein [Enterococcus sp. AZ102]|uniref:recombinase family protein n=1 Tax=unclassified Enterococcus TaxID=2608891 RepID=UPI003F23E4D6
MKVGYARVSKESQTVDRQLDLLQDYGVEMIIQEKQTGTKKERSGLDQLLLVIRPGDQVVVESISRLGRNTLDILELIQLFDKKNISFISLKEQLDTTTPTGKAMLQMMSVISELERNLLAERIREGLKASQKRGVRIGRPKTNPEVIQTALKMYDSEDYSVKEILRTTAISQGTLYRAIRERKYKEMENQSNGSSDS